MPEVAPDAVLAQLQPIFQEALNDPKLTVTRASNALNTPNWDSLAHIELIEMVESHFKVKFALGELQDLKEVGDLIDLIVKKSAKKG
jgi:acyl carrier protein